MRKTAGQTSSLKALRSPSMPERLGGASVVRPPRQAPRVLERSLWTPSKSPVRAGHLQAPRVVSEHPVTCLAQAPPAEQYWIEACLSFVNSMPPSTEQAVQLPNSPPARYLRNKRSNKVRRQLAMVTPTTQNTPHNQVVH
ncbi:hypothetical protein Taro_044651 [Colocasia esculenta]|uniref:Uncharacterized protein n=1 Tax=Colocasia esculenta TaxID=4460 RepID=A0A843X5P4_COLES|nr:hypothetical protein [Colocasia esculenta]